MICRTETKYEEHMGYTALLQLNYRTLAPILNQTNGD
jgi:hypothetical protein